MANSSGESFQQIVQRRLSRRQALKGSAALGLGSFVSGCCEPDEYRVTRVNGSASLGFTELPHGLDEQFTVADGYNYQTLIAWGDPLFEDGDDFDPLMQSESRQLKQFGYNNDFIGFVSLPLGSKNAKRGLLVVNHEATTPALMFPGSPRRDSLDLEQCKIDIAAHGLSVIEVEQECQQWRCVRNSKFNRRITPHTEMEMVGPAAGSPRLHTAISLDGVRTLGTYGNCAGGVTPWGTILSGEENVDGFFGGNYQQNDEREHMDRFGSNFNQNSWWRHFDRWNVEKNPREYLHTGWIVEVDPFEPDSKPRKHTALGRMKHEGANVHLNTDGRVVVYMGDDQAFEYIYKFVSKNIYDPKNRQANLNLLTEGDLFVARFQDDGSLQWLPLKFGDGPLTEEAGFYSQADVAIDVRHAADLVQATPMDRPEDVEVNPVNGRIYAMLTNNGSRTEDDIDGVNPRGPNKDGQVVEFWPMSGDHTNNVFQWELFLVAGKPEEVETQYHSGISENGWLSCPDNCAFDKLGNLWIATDGAPKRGIADGLWACEVDGENRALTKRFLRTPVGAEMCGPFFTPDSESLFCAVQHPASGSHYAMPSTRWPDFDETLPPRPAVVVVTKNGGGRIGS